MINLHDRVGIDAHRPIMIAHRGGVVAPSAPENSQNAIEMAAAQGYDMVELDVCCAADNIPILFHGRGGHGGMMVDLGISGDISELTSREAITLRYRGTDQTVLTLEAALDLCVEYELGVMLDMKTFASEPLPADYLASVRHLLVERDFDHALMTLSFRPEVRAALPATTLWPIRARNLQAMLVRDESLAGTFWFDDPDLVTDDEIQQLHDRSALTIACINSFRYPAHSFDQLEADDIRRMKGCAVDGYQIDSQYGHFFEKLTVTSGGEAA